MKRVVSTNTQVGILTTTMTGLTIAREMRCGSTGFFMISTVTEENVKTTQVGEVTN